MHTHKESAVLVWCSREDWRPSAVFPGHWSGGCHHAQSCGRCPFHAGSCLSWQTWRSWEIPLCTGWQGVGSRTRLSKLICDAILHSFWSLAASLVPTEIIIMSRPGPSWQNLLYLDMVGAMLLNSHATASVCGWNFLLIMPPETILRRIDVLKHGITCLRWFIFKMVHLWCCNPNIVICGTGGSLPVEFDLWNWFWTNMCGSLILSLYWCLWGWGSLSCGKGVLRMILMVEDVDWGSPSLGVGFAGVCAWADVAALVVCCSLYLSSWLTLSAQETLCGMVW